MAPFPGQEGPGTPSPGPIERRSVLVFPIAVAVVAVPGGPCRSFGPKETIDGLAGLPDAGILGGAEAEPDQLEKIGADLVAGGKARVVAAVLDQKREALGGKIFQDGRRNGPKIVSRHPNLSGKVGLSGPAPSFKAGVPGIGHPQGGFPLLGIEKGGSVDQGRNGHRQREEIDPRILLPSILACHGALPDDEGEGPHDHRPDPLEVEGALPGQPGGEKNREGRLVELETLPVGLAPSHWF
jgi:hypothetical protein